MSWECQTCDCGEPNWICDPSYSPGDFTGSDPSAVIQCWACGKAWMRESLDGCPSPETLSRMTGVQGVTARTIRAVETGQTEDPRLSTLLVLADVFGVTLDELAGR